MESKDIKVVVKDTKGKISDEKARVVAGFVAAYLDSGSNTKDFGKWLENKQKEKGR